MPDANPETIRGCKAWLGGPITLYASARWSQELERQFFVEAAREERRQRMFGTTLPWGPDAFLGSGIMKEYRAVPPQTLVEPTILISSPTDTYFDGNLIRLIPMALGEFEDLVTYVPQAAVAIISNWGKYLPDLGSVVHRYPGVEQTMNSLDYLTTLSPLNTILLLNGKPIVGASRVISAILAQRDALEYIRVATINAINAGVPLADMMATIELPDALTTGTYGPYVKELASTVPMIVRNVYIDYMGSFDGRVDHLESLTSYDEATRLIAFGGGENAVLNYAKKCLSEHTHEGVIDALHILAAVNQVCPSERATSYYIQALKMLAFDAKSAYLRNYYLSEIQEVQSP